MGVGGPFLTIRMLAHGQGGDAQTCQPKDQRLSGLAGGALETLELGLVSCLPEGQGAHARQCLAYGHFGRWAVPAVHVLLGGPGGRPLSQATKDK